MHSFAIEFLASERQHELRLDAERVRPAALAGRSVVRVEPVVRGRRRSHLGRLVLFLRRATA